MRSSPKYSRSSFPEEQKGRRPFRFIIVLSASYMDASPFLLRRRRIWTPPLFFCPFLLPPLFFCVSRERLCAGSAGTATVAGEKAVGMVTPLPGTPGRGAGERG